MLHGWILKTHYLVQFGVNKILHIYNDERFNFTKNIVNFGDSLARYLQLTVVFSNLVANFHMVQTFWFDYIYQSSFKTVFESLNK